MSSLNSVMVVGYLGRKPELRYTPAQTPYAVLFVATDEKVVGKDQKLQERTEWHRAVAWGRTAAACAEHLVTGRQVLVMGRLRTRSWKDREGHERSLTEILAERVLFLGSSGKRNGAPTDAVSPAPAPPEAAGISADDAAPF
jgi:single-strand DNA-binding protein